LNLHLYPSSLTNQSRILREVRSVRKLGLADEIIVVGVSALDLPAEEMISDKARLVRFNLVSERIGGAIGKALRLAEYLVRSLILGVRLKPDTVNCHSLNVLMAGVMLKALGRTRWLIYDAHELETERATLKGWPKRISKAVERFLIARVDRVQVVCDPIADWYRSTYKGVQVSVLRNVPNRRPSPQPRTLLLKEALGLGADDILFIYQGILSPIRGTELLVEAFAQASHQRHIAFMGYGPAEERLRDVARYVPNIHYHPAVSPDRILDYTASADVGMFVLDGDPCLSYRYSLPNKFFEYLHAGCPVIVSDTLAHLSELVVANGLGWVTRPEAGSIVRLVESIDRVEIQRRIPAARDFSHSNCWEDDEKHLGFAYGQPFLESGA
jgi:glycosyltransferase involved in cell wall biosynthesis